MCERAYRLVYDRVYDLSKPLVRKNKKYSTEESYYPARMRFISTFFIYKTFQYEIVRIVLGKPEIKEEELFKTFPESVGNNTEFYLIFFFFFTTNFHPVSYRMQLRFKSDRWQQYRFFSSSDKRINSIICSVQIKSIKLIYTFQMAKVCSERKQIKRIRRPNTSFLRTKLQTARRSYR